MCMNRALYPQCHWRSLILIHVWCQNNNSHSKLAVCQWCKLLDGSGAPLGHHISLEKSANFNLLESLTCAYCCCILRGSFFSDHSLAIALYVWRWSSVNIASTWTRALWYWLRYSTDPGTFCESLTASLCIFWRYMEIKTSMYIHFLVWNADFFDPHLAVPYRYPWIS